MKALLSLATVSTVFATTIRHRHGPRAAPRGFWTRDDSVQLFDSAAFVNVSSSCALVMASSVSCNGTALNALEMAYNKLIVLDGDDLAAACVQSCTDSLKNMHSQVLNACSDDLIISPQMDNATDYIPGTSVQYSELYDTEDIKPIELIEYSMLVYSSMCLKDSSSDWCYLRQINGGLDTCDSCTLDSYRAQMENALRYDEDLASSYTSIASSCGISVTPLATPTYEVTASSNGISTTTTTCGGSMVPVETGADCNDFARTHSVGTEDLLSLNGLTSGCGNFPGNKESLCVLGSCTPYTVQQNDTCSSISTSAGIQKIQLLTWNPFIDPYCKNLEKLVGEVICVSNPNGYTTPVITDWPAVTTTSSIWTGPVTDGDAFTDYESITSVWTHAPLTTSVANSSTADYPLANGSITGCYKMFNNDMANLLCDSAASLYNVDVDNWVKWNPSVLKGGEYNTFSCKLEQYTQYCGIFYDPSLASTRNDTSIAYIPPPSDATANATTECLYWYTTREGDTCTTLEQLGGITFAELYSWNPAIGANCQNMWINASYCLYGPSDSTDNSTTTPTDPNAPPTETQSGVASDCTGWYVAQDGDGCNDVAATHNITMDQFVEWNPAVTADTCDGFWVGYSYCIAVSGSASATTTSSTATTPTSTTATVASPTTTTAATTTTSAVPPGPTQSGIPDNCNRYDVAVDGDGCWSLANRNGITTDELYEWNPALNNDCENFWLDEAYCVGVSS